MTQKEDAETEVEKRDKEIAKLRDRLKKLHEKSQAEKFSLESDNVQLKVRLEEATKALDTWKIETRAEIGVSDRFSLGGR